MTKCNFLMGNGHKCKNEAKHKVGKVQLCEAHYKQLKKSKLI
jgi:hypothetical protein